MRQTPNPVTGSSVHWFVGDGMVHGVRLERGRAAWYRNRYVKTPYLANPDAPRVSERGEIDRTLSKANTHVLRHAGKILALEEGSFPYLLDGQLETLGWTDFDGKLRSAFTAHPKLCPVTGEMIAFGYGQLPPYLTYLRVSPDGRLVQSEEIEVGGPTMMHDFAITERYALFLWRKESSFRSWLFSIAPNLRKDSYRRGKGRVVLSIEDHDLPDGRDPASELVADETAGRIQAGLARLPRLQREVFLLRVQQGLDYGEIAEALGTTVGAARVHYHHAIKRLKELVP